MFINYSMWKGALWSRGEIIGFAVVGTLIGAAAHYFKQEADTAQAMLEQIPPKDYETCLGYNELKTKFGLDIEEIDCDREDMR